MLNKLKHRLSFYIVICCLPAFLLVGFVSFYGSWQVFEESLGIVRGLGFTDATLEHYKALFSSVEFRQNALFSLKVAFLSSAISILIGVVFAFRPTKKEPTKLLFFWCIFIILSYVASSLLIYNAFSDKGLLAKILYFTFGYNLSLNLVFNQNGIGPILVYVFKGAPFVLLANYALFAKINDKFYRISMNLGVTEFQYFLHILLPQAKRAIFATWLILFNFVLFSYEGFYFLGVSNPKSIGEMSVLLYNTPVLDKRPEAMTISAFSIMVSLILTFVYIRLVREKGGDNEIR